MADDIVRHAYQLKLIVATNIDKYIVGIFYYAKCIGFTDDDFRLIPCDFSIYRYWPRQILKNEGFTIFEAENGERAFLSINNSDNKIKYVFLDLRMPCMDGYSFLRIVNENARYADLKIFVLTAVDPKVFFNKISDMGIDPGQVVAFIEKPVNLSSKSKILDAIGCG